MNHKRKKNVKRLSRKDQRKVDEHWQRLMQARANTDQLLNVGRREPGPRFYVVEEEDDGYHD